MDKIKKSIPRGLKRQTRRIITNLVDAPRYYSFQRGVTYPTEISHIVFVCKGNICRSAFAEHFMRLILPDSAVTVESCGLDVDQGHFSPPEAVNAARKHGVLLEKHRSKGMNHCDLAGADLIVLMEYQQLLRFQGHYPQFTDKACLLSSFLYGPYRLFCNIYDPYGLPPAEYDRCFNLVRRAVDSIIEKFNLNGSVSKSSI